MAKKKSIILIIALLLLAVFFLPFPEASPDGDSTKVYSALIYKIVHWNKLMSDGVYEKTKIYFYPDSKKSIGELWLNESENSENVFLAQIIELNGSSAIVEPLENEAEVSSSDRFSINTEGFDITNLSVGTVVEIAYTGGIMETYPAQIKVTKVTIPNGLRHLEYTDFWLDKEKEENCDCEYDPFTDIVITQIYSNCFFATPVIPTPYTIKLNGTLSEEWCVGDQVICTYENVYRDNENGRIEVDFLTVEESDFRLDPFVCYKPVIYLYPEVKTDVTVKLGLNGQFTCTYPSYNNGWEVTALPDGTLTDKKGQTYSYLYWEGESFTEYDLSEGFCIKGEDTDEFLEYALEKLGLNRREANEFIVYWLPLMEGNPYNIISFQKESYTDSAALTVSPSPDTVIRVFMAWKASDSFVQLPEQELTAPERKGFTVIEWGGTEIKG